MVAAWWPLQPFWASDDFFALQYAQDPARALRDLAHWQYGAQDLWFFWRPLITLSFCFDAWFGGGAPFWAHLSNVIAHGISALLVGLLWRRWLGDERAFAAALLWSIAPGHVGTISWAVGRVDGHTSVWILLACWLFLRWCEGKDRTRLWSVLATLLALASKELAFAVPLLCSLLGLAAGRTRAGGAGRALLLAWPHWLLLAAALAFRMLVLGRFGGYAGTVLQPLPMLLGLLHYAADLLNPLRWADTAAAAAQLAAVPAGWLAWLPWLGWLPALVAVLASLHRWRWPVTAMALLLFLAAAAPAAGFFAGADNHHNLRYFYLAFAALAGLLVRGRFGAALALLVFAPCFLLARHAQWCADRESAAMHHELVQQTAGAAGRWYVAGLPHENAAGTVVQFHFGIDRMLLPPFAERNVQLYAHRPLLETPTALRLLDDVGLPVAVPGGHTLRFDGPELLTSIPEHALPPPLPVLAEWRARSSAPGPWQQDGATTLSSERLQLLKDGGLPDAARRGQGIEVRLRTPGVRPPLYRVTIFTSNGYLCAIVPDHAAGGAADGEIDLLRFFGGDHAAGIAPERVPPASCTTDGNAFVLRQLEVPTIVDLVPAFPVLVEAGALRGDQFAVTHRARQLLVLQFDRGYARRVRLMLGAER